MMVLKAKILLEDIKDETNEELVSYYFDPEFVISFYPLREEIIEGYKTIRIERINDEHTLFIPVEEYKMFLHLLIKIKSNPLLTSSLN